MSVFTVIESQEEFDNAISNSPICVVDFFGTWCGPCTALAESLTNLVKNDKLITSNLSSVTFIKVDVDEFEDLAVAYHISSLPHLIFYKNGKLTEHYVSGNKPQSIISTIHMLLNQ
jgi:thioredoxin 1